MKVQVPAARLLGGLAIATVLVTGDPSTALAATSDAPSSADAREERADAEAERVEAERQAARAMAEAARRAADGDGRPGQVVEIPSGAAPTGEGPTDHAPSLALGVLELAGAAAVVTAWVRRRTP